MTVLSRINLLPWFIALTISILIMPGCAPAPSFYLAPEYKNRHESEVSILVLPYVGKMMTPEQWEVFIQRKTKENKLVTNLEVELYENYFRVLLAERTYARVLPYDKGANPSDIRLQSGETEHGIEPKMDLLVPASGKVEINGATPEYLFVVQDLFFMKGKPDGADVRIPGGGNKIDFFMDAGIDYLIWDNKNERTVACGRLSKRTRLLTAPSKEHYLKILEGFVDSIVSNSPLSERASSF